MLSASEEWLKDRPKLEKAIHVFHKYGDQALEYLIHKKQSKGMLLHSMDNAEDEASVLSAQKENMNRMHTEAEAELNLLQKAERLQEGGGLDGLLHQETAALHSVRNLRRRTRLVESELSKVPATGPDAARLHSMDEVLRRRQAKLEKASRVLRQDRRRLARFTRSDADAAGEESQHPAEEEQAVSWRPQLDVVEAEYLRHLRRRSRSVGAKSGAGAGTEAADGGVSRDEEEDVYGDVRGQAGAVKRANPAAPADGFDNTDSRLECLPCVSGRFCRAGCRIVRRQ